MEHLEFELTSPAPNAAPRARAIVGVVASGNLEVLVERVPLAGRCQALIDTSISGYGRTWQAVLTDFAARHAAGDLRVSINDAGATPAVVSLRLDQALAELAAGRP